MRKQNGTILIVGVLVGVALLLILFRKNLGIVWDPMTEARLRLLHPEIRKDARQLINKAEVRGIYLRIPPDGGNRKPEEQMKLYLQGRTLPGKIVTNAKPGYSYHNYGLALDVVEIKEGKALWENSNWRKIGDLGKSLGFAWGGDWGKPDYPHFYKGFGYKPSQLLAKSQANQFENNYIKVA